MPVIRGMLLTEGLDPFVATKAPQARVALEIVVHFGEFDAIHERPAGEKDLRAANYEKPPGFSDGLQSFIR
jgi:hypothetical protein